MRFLLLGIVLVVLSACLDEPDCIITATNMVQISFYKVGTDTAREVHFSKVMISGIDSAFYAGDTLTSMSLPVNPGTTSTTFRFYYDFAMDSVVVSYTRDTRMISPQCGAFNYFQDLDIISASFPEVIVLNPQLSAGGSTNLAIKF